MRFTKTKQWKQHYLADFVHGRWSDPRSDDPVHMPVCLWNMSDDLALSRMIRPWTLRKTVSGQDRFGPEQSSVDVNTRKMFIKNILMYTLILGTSLGTFKVTVSNSSTISIIEYYMCVLWPNLWISLLMSLIE